MIYNLKFLANCKIRKIIVDEDTMEISYTLPDSLVGRVMRVRHNPLKGPMQVYLDAPGHTTMMDQLEDVGRPSGQTKDIEDEIMLPSFYPNNLKVCYSN